MKTIEVNDEMYEFLSNLSKEIKTQDNRGTAKPYFYQVQTDEQICVPEDCGEEVWVNYDGRILRTGQDMKEAVFEYNGWKIGNKEDEELYAYIDRWDEEEFLKKFGYRNINIGTRNVFSNCFITEKACRDYIERDKHNLNNPHTYLFHAPKNNELEMLFKFFEESFNK